MNAAIPSPKTSTKHRVFLINGEDELSVASKARELIRRIIPPEQEMLGLETINARADTVAEAIAFLTQCRASVQTLGFLGKRKVTWLRNANFLDQSIIGKSKDVHEHLKYLAAIIQAGLPAEHVLVISAPLVDAKSKFYQACKTTGTVIGLDTGKPWQRDKSAYKFIVSLFQKIGLTASPDVITAFLRKTGTDSRQLQQEAEKLSIYLGDKRTAQLKDIETVVSPARELFTWDLDDAVANRDLAAALRILRQLLFQKEAPIRLIFGLESRFRSLLVLREGLDRGWVRMTDRGMLKGAITPEQEQLFFQALNDNRLKNPYIAGIRIRQAAAYTIEALDQCRRWILETRRHLVSSSLPAAWLMDMLIVKICRR